MDYYIRQTGPTSSLHHQIPIIANTRASSPADSYHRQHKCNVTCIFEGPPLARAEFYYCQHQRPATCTSVSLSSPALEPCHLHLLMPVAKTRPLSPAPPKACHLHYQSSINANTRDLPPAAPKSRRRNPHKSAICIIAIFASRNAPSSLQELVVYIIPPLSLSRTLSNIRSTIAASPNI